MVRAACDKSIENLNLGPIDLYLMHTPMGYEYRGFGESDLNALDADGNVVFSEVDYVDTWKAMEKLQQDGLVRNIGLSNFNSEQIDQILAVATIKPVTNQIECSANLNQLKFIEFCKQRDITVTAYGPLGRPHRVTEADEPALKDARVQALADKYNKTVGQILLRFLVILNSTVTST